VASAVLAPLTGTLSAHDVRGDWVSHRSCASASAEQGLEVPRARVMSVRSQEMQPSWRASCGAYKLRTAEQLPTGCLKPTSTAA